MLLALALSLVIGGAILTLAGIAGRRTAGGRVKLSTYESGLPLLDRSRKRISDRLLPDRHRLRRLRRRSGLPLPLGAGAARGRLAAVLGGHGIHRPDPGRATPTSGRRAASTSHVRGATCGGPLERAPGAARGPPRPVRRRQAPHRRAATALPHRRRPAAAGPAHRAARKRRLAAARRSWWRWPTISAWHRSEGHGRGLVLRHLPQHPVGRHRIRVCTNLSCQLRGADEIIDTLRRELGVDEDEVTPDGRCSYVHFECLGSCDTAPMMMVDDDYHENLTPDRLREIVCGAGLMAFERVLTRNVGNPAALTVAATAKPAATRRSPRRSRWSRTAVIDEVKKSGLRGRGGAGFPCGLKWSFIPQAQRQAEVPRLQRRRVRAGHLQGPAADGARSAPADRGLRDLLAGRCGANTCLHLHPRRVRLRRATCSRTAIRDAYDARHPRRRASSAPASSSTSYVHRGAGAYICGEETGLLESLEGKRGQPRVKPPFPAVVGAFGCPTVINNVETLCCVPHILAARRRLVQVDRHRRAQHRARSSTRSPATSSGPASTSSRSASPSRSCSTPAAACQGTRRSSRPSSRAAPRRRCCRPAERDIKMDFDTVAKAGSMLGSAAVIVMDDTVCIVRSAARLAKFFAHESCGQCTPCREGTNWMRADPRAASSAARGSEGDLDLLLRVATNIERHTICALGDAARRPGALAGRELPRRDRAAHPRPAAARCRARRSSTRSAA